MNPPAREAARNRNTAALRNNIRDLGDQIDSYNAKTAGAIGASVFLLLLALGGIYDLINHNTSISGAIGISQDAFRWLVIALGGLGTGLFLLGIIRRARRDHNRELHLATLERELARLESDTEHSE